MPNLSITYSLPKEFEEAKIALNAEKLYIVLSDMLADMKSIQENSKNKALIGKAVWTENLIKSKLMELEVAGLFAKDDVMIE